jgi:hypothetical protein
VAFSLTGDAPADWKTQLGKYVVPGGVDVLSGNVFALSSARRTSGSRSPATRYKYSLTGPVPNDWVTTFGVPNTAGAQILSATGDNSYVTRLLLGSSNIGVTQTGDFVTFSLTGPAPAGWSSALTAGTGSFGA